MRSIKRSRVWDNVVFEELKLEVPSWVSNILGQKFLDHPIPILFLFLLISFVSLGSTSWVMILGRSSKCCTQVSFKPLIKTKNFYSHKMIEPYF